MSNMYDFMTPRLLAIADMVDVGASIIDVGCDHGYIPVFLAGEGKILRAIASDVNDGPLRAAEKNIKKYGLEEKISTAKSNGLCDVSSDGYDTIIIAGMGGVLISEILSYGVRGKTYILQPMTAVEYLMEFLSDNGFKVVEHRLAEEENHIYNIIKVVDGDEKTEGIDLYLGKKIKKNNLYYKYADVLKRKFEKIISGLSNSKNEQTDQIEKFKGLILSLERNLNE